MRTVPTTITEEQYKAAFFAVNPENNACFLVWQDNGQERILYVGNDEETANNSNPDSNPDCSEKQVYLNDEVDHWSWVDCWCYSTKDSWADLDLEELAEGKILWH